MYNHIDDDTEFYTAIMEVMLDCPFNFHEISKKVFVPFEINDEFDTPLAERDPDMQFYLESNYIKNTKCDYYIEDTFIKNIWNKQEDKRALSMFHMYIKSLPKHFDELQQYLNVLKYDFSVISISETWLSENNADLYDLSWYVTIKCCRKERRGGGVSLYIRDEIPFTTRSALAYFDTEMESIFIEIDTEIFRTNSNIVIGLIYRMPDSSVVVFNERITYILNTVCQEHKTFYCIGDLNIDFFKCDVHKPTSAILDTLYTYNAFPLITKPTRVTETTATLIDHILTNNINIASEHAQGILCTDISDHYAIFHIAGNIKYDAMNTPTTRLIRDMRQCNINKFVNEMQIVEWAPVTNKSDTQAA